nr:MAG TPA: hypothetical protein [Caudoviricetes sp.]
MDLTLQITVWHCHFDSLRLLGSVEVGVDSSVGVRAPDSVDLCADGGLHGFDSCVVSFLRSIAPYAIGFRTDSHLSEGDTEREGSSAPVRCCSYGVAAGPSVGACDVIRLSSDGPLKRGDVFVTTLGSAPAGRRVRVSGSNHICDRVVTNTAPYAITRGLRAVASGRGVALDRLQSTAAKIPLNEADMIRASAVPVKNQDISGLGIINRNEVSFGMLAYLVDCVIRVEGEAANGVDLSALIKAHTDEQHTPPHRVGRSSKPLLSSSSSPVSPSFRSGIRVVRGVVADPCGSSCENIVCDAHFITSVVWDT